jgi:hypothetical protein
VETFFLSSLFSHGETCLASALRALASPLTASLQRG